MMYLENNINRLPLVFKTESGRHYFQFHINGQLASLEYYMIKTSRIVLTRLEISKYLNQVEVGNALIERVLEYIHRVDLKVLTTNPVVKKYIQKNPEYKKLEPLDFSLTSLSNSKARRIKS